MLFACKQLSLFLILTLGAHFFNGFQIHIIASFIVDKSTLALRVYFKSRKILLHSLGRVFHPDLLFFIAAAGILRHHADQIMRNVEFFQISDVFIR